MKPTFNKLKLSLNTENKEFTWEDQVIEVKQYLSIQDKLNLISEVLSNSVDENRFFNKGKVDLFFKLYIIYYYTNISFTDKQKEDFIKTYDTIYSSGFWNKIKENIPEEELNYLYDLTINASERIYAYKNSVYGVLDAMNTDYDNLNLDIDALTKKLKNKENVEFLNEVLTKMG